MYSRVGTAALMALALVVAAGAQLSPSPDAMAAWQQGLQANRGQDWAGAAAAFSRAITADPKFFNAYLARSADEARLLEYPAALADANQSLQLASNPAQAAGAHFERATAEQGLNQTPAALADLRAGVGAAPAPWNFYSRMAELEEKQGDLPAALADRSRAITADPYLPGGYAARSALERRMGDTASADADATKFRVLNAARRAQPAAAAAPTSPMNQATGEFRQGHWQAALDLARQILQQHPQDVAALNLAANCSLRMNDYTTAIAGFQGTLAIVPNQPNALVGLVEAYARAGQMVQRDATRAQIRALANTGAIAPAAAYPIDWFETPSGMVQVIEYAKWMGRFHWRDVFEVRDASFNVVQRIALETDDFDQPQWAREHPQLAAAGGRVYSLDSYTATQQALIRFFENGEPSYADLRAEVIKLLTPAQ